jgi:hypothetical protein
MRAGWFSLNRMVVPFQRTHGGWPSLCHGLLCMLLTWDSTLTVNDGPHYRIFYPD